VEEGAYAVEVQDHIMIAHSFKGEVFGPAQAVHGATFVVSVAYLADDLDKNGIVVDIGRAIDVLKETLGPINYKNLDDLPEFKGKNTTTRIPDQIRLRQDRRSREGEQARTQRP